MLEIAFVLGVGMETDEFGQRRRYQEIRAPFETFNFVSFSFEEAKKMGTQLVLNITWITVIVVVGVIVIVEISIFTT